MVGKKTKINEFVKKWLNKPFELGKYDCLQMIKEFYNLPDKWNGIDIKNGKYIDLWINNKEKAIEIYKQFIKDNFKQIDNKQKEKGDLIIIDDFIFTVGIYLGNNKYVTFNEQKGCYISKIIGKYFIYRRK